MCTPCDAHIFLSTARHVSHSTVAQGWSQGSTHLCVPQKHTSSSRLMALLGVPRTTSRFCSPLSPFSPRTMHLFGTSAIPEYAAPRACGSSGGLAENAHPSGSEPNKLDSKTCIDVSSEYTPINIAVRRENVNIEDDFFFAVPEDSDVLHRQTVGSQRCAASAMPALRNLDSLSSTEKSVRGYETIVQSFSSIGKPMQATEHSQAQRNQCEVMNQLQVLKETCQEHKLIEITIQETDLAFVSTLKGMLKLPLKEKMKHEEDSDAEDTFILGNGNRENQNSP